MLAFLLSRLFVVAVGVVAVLLFGTERSDSWDIGGFSQPFSRLGDLLVATTSHWDSVFYAAISLDGYETYPERPAFFPLYPLTIHLLRPLVDPVLASEQGATLATGVVTSCLACFVALYLLHRLVELDFGDAVARRAVILTAVFPTSFFLSAVYTEALFLALSVAAVYAARRGRWPAAGLLGALAAATRVQGVLLALPLSLLALYGPREDRPPTPGVGWRPRYRPGRTDAGWLLLVPLGLVAFCAYLWIVLGDPLASFQAHTDLWHRHLVFPAVAAVQGGLDALWALSNVHDGVSPITDWLTRAALTDLGFLAFGLVASVGALRRLPTAYSAYAIAGIVLALSSVPDNQHDRLMTFPRIVVALFPLFIWLALWARTPRRWLLTVSLSLVLLAFYAGLFATFHWVA
jgi:hypothetical protein